MSTDSRVIELLRMLAVRLTAQRAGGSDYYWGKSLTAAGIHAAAILALFQPLPQPQCFTRCPGAPVNAGDMQCRDDGAWATLMDRLWPHLGVWA